ncbi:MAG: YebC/PmpR family DNA-binding transcriptional regulator [Dehalococcoidia bacterium]
MSGHSKWSQIKRQKGVADARRGQLFTKLAKEITVAAREAGGNPDTNFRLRMAVQRARDSNMPLDNIERAIKRASASEGGQGTELVETIYEGYAPGGAAIMLQVLTDNKNRTVSDVRSVFSRSQGSLGESGCVAWNFEPKGLIAVDTSKEEAEKIALLTIDAGAEDVKLYDNSIDIYTKLSDLERVRQALEGRGVTISSAEASMVPKTVVTLDEKAAMQTLRLMDKLEELDDVQRVYTNADFPEEVLASYRAQA